jgi:hypothetical protein
MIEHDLTEKFIAYIEELDALADPDRGPLLLKFARSHRFHPAGMMLEGWQGALHREAYQILRASLDRDTPGRAWDLAFNVADRRTICRALKIDPAEQGAFYATFPFRIVRDGDKAWIAGAIGCQRALDPNSVRDWRHTDVSDVILWNPRTGHVQLAGDPSATLIEPADYANGRYNIYGDGFAFFRAWADKRAEIGAGIISAKASNSHIIPVEPVDSGMPGALVIGDLDQVRWRDLNATVLVAGPGIDPQKLNRAIFRSARLPRVEAA